MLAQSLVLNSCRLVFGGCLHLGSSWGIYLLTASCWQRERRSAQRTCTCPDSLCKCVCVGMDRWGWVCAVEERGIHERAPIRIRIRIRIRTRAQIYTYYQPLKTDGGHNHFERVGLLPLCLDGGVLNGRTSPSPPHVLGVWVGVCVCACVYMHLCVCVCV